LKRAAGFIEDQPGQSSTDWKPNRQLWVGFKAVEGSRRTLYFVQLTTSVSPRTNSAGQPWQPVLRTNKWAWSRTNKTQFVSELYPVRVRVFDETGRQLKGGQTPMAWGILTNWLDGLVPSQSGNVRQEGEQSSQRSRAVRRKTPAPKASDE
jgi:hypothetical protein